MMQHSRSELKRTLDHAELVTPDHQRLIQKLLDDEVLDHGGNGSSFATLVTTAVYLARGGAS